MNPFKSLRQRSCGCCLLLVLIFLLLVAGLIFLIVRAASAENLPPAYDVVLISDQSTSMWDCDGIGTDPELLRVDATRLFINTLGADSSARYRLALLHFGGGVQPVAPLTDLADATARQALIEAASHPQPLRWTDHLLALRAAERLLQKTGQPGSQRLIVLLTDGEPAPNPLTYAGGYAEAKYVQELQANATELAQADTTLAVVLLNDTRTSCGRRAALDWAARWTSWAELTPGGEMYAASQAEDLLPIYHAIVRQLLGSVGSAAPVATGIVSPGTPFVVDVPLAEPLASLILTIWKRDSATTVAVRDPTGQVITPSQAAVAVTGHTTDAQSGGPAGRTEVWRVARPQQGTWQVILAGQGRVSVWQDRLLLPTPTPSATPMPSATVTVSATPTPTASRTATTTRAATATRTPPASTTPSPPAAPTVPATVTPTATLALGAAGRPTGTGGALGRPAWPLWAGGGTLGLATLGLLALRRSGPYLTGQLAPVAVPAGSPLAQPRDLSHERRRQVILGRRGEQAWRLEGWSGAVRLTAANRRSVTISPVAGEATLDGWPLRQPTALADGVLIGCGEYQIRYENLLA